MSTTSPRAICWPSNAAGSASATSWAARTCSLQELLADGRRASPAGVRRASSCRACRCSRWPFGAEAVARLTGKEPLLTVDGLRMSRYRMFFTSAKAERELGYRSRPYQEGVVDALAWFRQGRLPRHEPGYGSGRSRAWRIWLYLLVARGGFWLTRERDDRQVLRPPAALAGRGGRRARPQRSGRDRAFDRKPAAAGLSRLLPHRAGG